MPKYIDADAYIKYCEENWIALNVDAVNKQPEADVEPVRQGRWVYDSDGIPCCSECGEFALQRLKLQLKIKSLEASFVKSNCCPNCGAKMNKEEA